MAQDQQPLLKVENLAVSFPVTVERLNERGKFERQTRRVRAVNNVSMTVYERQTLAVVGESGCGKSVSALSSLQLVPTPPGKYEQGHIWWSGNVDEASGRSGGAKGSSGGGGKPTDLLTLPDKKMRNIRGNQIAMIFQEPMTSLNPVYSIGDQIIEAILLHQNVNKSQAVQIAIQSLEDVGISDAPSRLKGFPHQLSGGMRQRVMIAMALACQPRLLLADEPTTALDVTIQAQILELLRKLQHDFNMAILLITHDLGVVAENADVVAVMYAGRVVEYGSVFDVFEDPLHPYTHGLFESMPVLGKSRERLVVIEGQVPNLASQDMEYAIDPSGKLTDQKVVADPTLADVVMVEGKPTRVFRRRVEEQPELRMVKPNHWVACFDSPGYDDAPMTHPDLNFRREHASEQEAAH
jgi:ABC-type dipeptide/oligopeptide/nickel transport system ATPase component